MATKSQATDRIAELGSDRLLSRKTLELDYLQHLIADKEKAFNTEIDEVRRGSPSSQSSLPHNQTVSRDELPENSRKFLDSFLADRGALSFRNKT
ncbi:hypothetical protein [Bradyrhizobium retamae]|uniref:hypothetical protein n=1 Tax=Bradyrhizobium retamae TaxID=1300035 RepID=UPI000A78ADBE|nr:hypothetical protein [Bradyrhizobium retamae]